MVAKYKYYRSYELLFLVIKKRKGGKKMKFKTAFLLTVGIVTLSSGVFQNNAFASNSVDTLKFGVQTSVAVNYGSLIKTYSDVEKYVALVDQYKLDYPQATIKELDQFLSQEMGKDLAKNGGISVLGYDDVPYVEGMLNAEELKVFNSNKYYGLQALVAGQKAKNYSEDKYVVSSLHNGNGDAFRHMLWNSMMRNYTTLTYATDFATAHENGSTGQPIYEKTMDLFNNSVGRGITFAGTNLEGEINALLAVGNAVDTGKGKRIDTSGVLVPTNTGGKK